MSRTLALLAAAIAILAGAPAAASGHASDATRVGTDTGALTAWVHQSGGGQPRRASHRAASLPPGVWITRSLCAPGAPAACSDPLRCPDGTVQTETWYETDDGRSLYAHTSACPAQSPEPPPAASEAETGFKQLPLPASPLLIQPGGGHTRVNLETIFYTSARPFTRTVRLLGHTVTFHITPATYTWNFGDGHTVQTDWPGQPYDQDVPLREDITHRYETAGTFQPRLDTTYAATYTVDGGPTLDVDGTVTVKGNPVTLTADTYTPVLVR